MNNKYLAVILVIVAVLLVGYRIFSPGDQNDKPQQASNTPPGIQDPGLVPVTGLPDPQGNEESIKIEPEVLLENIDYQNLRYEHRELGPGGTNILFERTYKADGGSLEESAEDSEGDYKYSLFAIIIDRERRLAVINDRICRIGDILPGGAWVESIKKGKVELKIGKDTLILLTNPRIEKIIPAG